MIVIIANAFAPHADVVAAALTRKNASYVRLNTEDFPRRATMTLTPDTEAGTLRVQGTVVRLADVTTLWYHRPQACRVADSLAEDAARFARIESNAVMGALYRNLRARFWVNPPWAEDTANDKLLQLMVAGEHGLRTPRTLITNDAAEAGQFFTECGEKMVYKLYGPQVDALDGGVGGRIFTSRVRRDHLRDTSRFRSSPAFFQELVDKRSELRVTVIGDRVFATEIHSQEHEVSQVDWRRGAGRLRHSPATLPLGVEEKCLGLTRALGLVFGAIDLIVTPEGEYVFLEINPSGLWLWLEFLTQQPLLESFCQLLVQGRSDYVDDPGGPGVTAAEIAPLVPPPARSLPPAAEQIVARLAPGGRLSAEDEAALLMRFPPSGPPPPPADLESYLESLLARPTPSVRP